jgi:pilus assembly protein CpaD
MRPALFRIIPLIFASTFSACSSLPGPKPEQAVERPLTPTEQFAGKTDIDPMPREIRLAPRADGLSPNQQRALDALVADWMDAGTGEIVIQETPDGQRTARAAYGFLASRGLPVSALRLVSAPEAGPVTVGFMGYVATPPRCGNWSSFTALSENQPNSNFGCAVQANIAAQVADPQDLLRPRTQTPIDAGRRSTVLEAYRQGRDPSTQASSQASGAVSAAVN